MFSFSHSNIGFYIYQEFFAELQARQSEFGVKDIQLGLTTLEEVFMNIAKQADVETAIAEGRFKTLTLNSGDSVEVSQSLFT